MTTGDDSGGTIDDPLEFLLGHGGNVRTPNRGSVEDRRLDVGFVNFDEGFFGAAPRSAG